MKLNWETFKRIIDILQSIAVIGGIVVGVATLEDTRKIESAKFVREITLEINKGTNKKILYEIEDSNNNGLILKKFSNHEISDFIDNYEQIGILYNEGLIADDIIYEEFSYDIEKIWCNKDMHNYIKALQKSEDDKNFYGNLEDLAAHLLKKDGYLKDNNYEASCALLDNK